jgi:hypothetical protein
VLWWAVQGCAVCAISVRFSMKHKQAEQQLHNEAPAQRAAMHGGVPAMA